MASDLSSVGRAHIILAEVNHSFPVNLEEARGIHGGSKEEQGEICGSCQSGKMEKRVDDCFPVLADLFPSS